MESLQSETRQAVSFMQGGVQDVDSSLRLTEEASSENVHLHEAVERMFEIIKGLNERSLHYGQTIRGVDQASNEMGRPSACCRTAPSASAIPPASCTSWSAASVSVPPTAKRLISGRASRRFRWEVPVRGVPGHGVIRCGLKYPHSVTLIRYSTRRLKPSLRSGTATHEAPLRLLSASSGLS